MFTGLVQQLGILRSREANWLRIACAPLVAQLKEGDSVAVDGVCLTVAQLHADGFTAQILPDTTVDTTLNSLPLGAKLNLEPALRLGDRLGGHFVQGHVAGTVKLLRRQQTSATAWCLRFELPGWLIDLVFLKGSVALNGVSLTVQAVEPSNFSVGVIPETHHRTNLGQLAVGASVNVEPDIIVMAVRHLLLHKQPSEELTLTRLRNLGYDG